jgi:hypothetical protein
MVPGSDVGIHVESTMLVPTNGLPMRIHPPDGEFTSSPIAGRVHELVEFDEAPAFAAGECASIDGESASSVAPRLPR